MDSVAWLLIGTLVGFGISWLAIQKVEPDKHEIRKPRLKAFSKPSKKKPVVADDRRAVAKEMDEWGA